MSDMLEPALVPELLVADLEESLAFWVGISGFSISYDRPEERFAYLALGSAHLMLEQEGVGRNWITGPLERPLGRGINFQISVTEGQLETILAAETPPKPQMRGDGAQYQFGAGAERP